MITYEGTESIARPPSEVFAFVSDIRNEPRWHTDILEARLIKGSSVAKGSKFGVKFKPFMGQSEGTITIVEYEARDGLCFEDGWARWNRPSSTQSRQTTAGRGSHAGSTWNRVDCYA